MNLKKVFSWLCCCLLLLFGFVSSSVSAISSSGKKGFTTATLVTEGGGYQFTLNCVSSNFCYRNGNISQSGWITFFNVTLTSGVYRGDVIYFQLRLTGSDNTGFQGLVPDQHWSVVTSEISSTQMNSNSQMTWIQTMTLTPRDENVSSIIFNGSRAFWAHNGSTIDISGGNYYYDGTSQITDAINGLNIPNYSTVLGQIHSDTTGAETNTRNIYNLLNGQIKTDLSSSSTNLNTIRQQLGNNSGNLYYNGSVQSSMSDYFSNVIGSKSYADISTTTHQFQYLQTNALLAIAEKEIQSNQFNQQIAQNTTNISNYADEQRQADSNISSQSASDIGGSTDSKTESLLASATGFATVLTNVNPSNCRINGNMGHFNIGQIDMCSDNPPSFIQIIGSLIMVVILVGLSYALVNQILNLVKEMRQ